MQGTHLEEVVRRETTEAVGEHGGHAPRELAVTVRCQLDTALCVQARFQPYLSKAKGLEDPAPQMDTITPTYNLNMMNNITPTCNLTKNNDRILLTAFLQPDTCLLSECKIEE